jgi:quercetin dioxygenase-like cupin family protein/DNA-binding XRE family transcriptional regulator
MLVSWNNDRIMARMDVLPANLVRLRKQASLTQAELAEAANIPRATLASMEQPSANPSIQAVMAVAKALNVSLDELLVLPPEHRYFLVSPREMQDYRADNGRYAARLVSPIASKGVQIHHVTLQPGCHSVGRPHPIGAQEFFHCLEGTATVQIEDESVEVPAGSLIQFPGHRHHVYLNKNRDRVAVAMSVVVFRMG